MCSQWPLSHISCRIRSRKITLTNSLTNSSLVYRVINDIDYRNAEITRWPAKGIPQSGGSANNWSSLNANLPKHPSKGCCNFTDSKLKNMFSRHCAVSSQGFTEVNYNKRWEGVLPWTRFRLRERYLLRQWCVRTFARQPMPFLRLVSDKMYVMSWISKPFFLKEQVFNCFFLCAFLQ